jgi:hypothetical protein
MSMYVVASFEVKYGHMLASPAMLVTVTADEHCLKRAEAALSNASRNRNRSLKFSWSSVG